MPKGYPITRCKVCGQPVHDRRELSVRGKHLACGARVQAEQIKQLVAHSGPHFDYWRERCMAAFANPRLDQPRPER